MKKDIHNENLGITIQVTDRLDGSFRREPVIFRGIANNLIYLESYKTSFDGKRWISKLEIENWAENWALFEIPEGLTFDECVSKY